MSAKGWHSRGYLPHYDGPGVVQHIIFHLIDAAPEGEHIGDDVLDRGHGSAILRQEPCARIVIDALLHDNDRKYVLHAWCVMPTHVHVLAIMLHGYEQGAVVREWKTITARRINGSLGRTGPLWAKEYFDRFTRDQAHYDATKQYIERNPVAAGLCETPEAWPFSSAGRPI